MMKQNPVDFGDSPGIKNHHPMKGIIFKEDVALKEPQSKPFNE